MSEAIDTTSVHNKEFKTFIPQPLTIESYQFGPEAKATKLEPVTGYDLWRWPEWQALMTRLAVDMGAPTTRLTVSVGVDDLVKIVHEFNGLDLNTPLGGR